MQYPSEKCSDSPTLVDELSTPSYSDTDSYTNRSAGGYTTSGEWYEYNRTMKSTNNTHVSDYSQIYLASEITHDCWLYDQPA